MAADKRGFSNYLYQLQTKSGDNLNNREGIFTAIVGGRFGESARRILILNDRSNRQRRVVCPLRRLRAARNLGRGNQARCQVPVEILENAAMYTGILAAQCIK